MEFYLREQMQQRSERNLKIKTIIKEKPTRKKKNKQTCKLKF